MSDIIIKVENLNKLYKIGAKQEHYKTLRDTLANAVTGPLHRFRSLLSAPSFNPSALCYLYGRFDVLTHRLNDSLTLRPDRRDRRKYDI